LTEKLPELLYDKFDVPSNTKGESKNMHMLRNWMPRDHREKQAAILAAGGIAIAAFGIIRSFSATVGDTRLLSVWGLVLILVAYRLALSIARYIAFMDE
jgi:hypothetical protein